MAGPLYVSTELAESGKFPCYQGGFMFEYDLDRIKAAIDRGEDVRDWATMPGAAKQKESAR